MYFLYPYMLFLLLPIVTVFIYKSNKVTTAFSKEVFKKITYKSGDSFRYRKIFFALSLIFMVLALARPVVDNGSVKLQREKSDVLIAIDMSLSMGSEDVFPSRFLFAKNKVKSFLSNLSYERVATVAFTDNLFLITLPSSDYESVKYMVDSISRKYATGAGSDITFLIKHSDRIYKKNFDLVIFSDGSDEKNFNEAIKIAKDRDIRVSVVSIATAKGAPILNKDGSFYKDSSGNIVYSRANRGIELLCKESGGICVKYSNSEDDVMSVISHIEQKSRVLNSKKEVRMYKELFVYMLIASLVFLLIAFISIPKLPLAMLLFASLFINKELHATNLNDAKGYYNKGDYNRALKIYNDNKKDSDKYRYNLGNIYYKKGEYDKAIESYKSVKDKLLLQKASYNSGNSYYQKKEYKNALKSYKKALSYGKDADAKYNYNVVKKLLHKPPKQQNSSNSNENKKSNENKEANSKNSQNSNSNMNKNSGSKKSKDSKNESQKNRQDSKNSSKQNPKDGKTNGKENSRENESAKEPNSVKDKKENSSEKSAKEGQNSNSNVNKNRVGNSKNMKSAKEQKRDKRLDEKYKIWYNRLKKNDPILIPLQINDKMGRY